MESIFEVIITYWNDFKNDYVEEVYGWYKDEKKAHEIADKIREKQKFKQLFFAYGIEENVEEYDIYDVRVGMIIVNEEPFNEEYFVGEREE